MASTSIQWGSCAWASIGADYECTNFTVPMDYANPSVGDYSLAVVRYRARTQPPVGTMYFNVGGPGVSIFSGLKSFDYPPYLQTQIGDDWDIVSWDPRAVGPSEPKLLFFQNYTEENAFWLPAYQPGEFYSLAPLWDQQSIDQFMTFESERDTLYKTFNDLAVARNGDHLKYIGTAANTRDLVALVDAIDGPSAPVNFWGFSYGTLMSAFLTQMFPARVGKVIFDGVVDPADMTQYQSFLGTDLELSDSEAVWKGFTRTCAEAGPANCTFAQPGDTPETIDSRVETIALKLASGYNETQYPSSNFLNIIFGMLYRPSRWGDLDTYLLCMENALAGNPTNTTTNTNGTIPTSKLGQVGASGGFDIKGLAKTDPFHLLERKAKSSPSPAAPVNLYLECPRPGGDDDEEGDPSSYYAIYAIYCGDTADSIGQTTHDIMNQVVRVVNTTSRKFGGNTGDQRYFCHRWETRAVERYQGPWNKELANVVLVIGNEADPVTPYRSAKKVASAEFLGNNSRLVQRWDFGHCSNSEYSPCIYATLNNYTHGTLPPNAGTDEADIECPVSQSLFGLALNAHYDPVTSENGDPATSGPNDPGLAGLNSDSNGSTGAATVTRPFGGVLVVLSLFGVVLACL
ncbi:hypothetical protein CPB86DRAFT_737163 [Serendipita vermifera]|nr:hypothetical protein CPB86DRAFT_737163 [Serendipita vermifera]